MKWFKNIKLSLETKLFISNFFYALPIVVLLFLMIQAKNKDIDFSAKEKIGNEYQKPVMEMLAATVVMTDKNWQENKIVLEKNFPLYEAVQKKYAESLEFTTKGLGSRQREIASFENIAKLVNNLKMQFNDEDRVKLIAGLRLVVVQLGDTSNLILDPDLDSYYLMDITLLAFPQMFERLNTIKTLLLKNELTKDDNLALAIQGELLKSSDVDRIISSYQTVKNEDGNFYGVNELVQKDLDISYNKLRDNFSKIGQLVKDKIEARAVPPAKVMEVMSSSSAIAIESFHLSINALDQLLDARLAEFFGNKKFALTLGGLAIAVALLISIFTAFNFREGTKKIIMALEKLSSATKINERASDELASSSSILSSSSTEQAAALQETVSTLEEINAMVAKSLENTQLTEKMTIEGNQSVTKGKDAIGNVVLAMKDINSVNDKLLKEVSETNKKLNQIAKIIGDIEGKTKVIDEIVFQTKLLSFNASVEAARAGDAGKGFTVVAEEVGNLAEMSGKASTEISQMLKNSIVEVNRITRETEVNMEALILESQEKIKNGTLTVDKTSQELFLLTDRVHAITELMTEVATAIEEQSRGIGEITQAMHQIDQGVHSNVELSENTFDMAEKLKGQVSYLSEIVRTIEFEVSGKA